MRSSQVALTIIGGILAPFLTVNEPVTSEVIVTITNYRLLRVRYRSSDASNTINQLFTMNQSLALKNAASKVLPKVRRFIDRATAEPFVTQQEAIKKLSPRSFCCFSAFSLNGPIEPAG